VPQQFRYDRAQIGPQWEETPEGYLRVTATFSRSGLQRYRRMDGSEVVEYRPEEEVSSQAALLSLANLPVTLEHPPELLTPDTVRQHQRGFTGSNVEYKSPFATGVVTITDREAIEAVKRGDSREVSVGYRVEFDPTPGVTPDGERFDGVQRRISGNHLAIVREARGGREVRLHMDAAYAIETIPTSTPAPPPSTEATPMATTLQALTSATDAIAEVLKKQARLDGEEAKEKPYTEGEVEDEEGMEGMEGDPPNEDPDPEEDDEMPRGDSVSKADYLKVVRELEKERADHQRDLGRIDSLVDRLDSLEQEMETRQDGATDLNALVAARMELLDKAEQVAGRKLRLDGLETDRDIMLAALAEAGAETTRLDSQSDEYVAGQFEAYAERPRLDSSEILAAALRGSRSDSTDDPIEAARQRMAQETESAWASTPD